MDALKKLINKKKEDMNKLIATKQAEAAEPVLETDRVSVDEKPVDNDTDPAIDHLQKRPDNPTEEAKVSELSEQLPDEAGSMIIDNSDAAEIDIVISDKLNKDFKDETEEMEALRRVILEDLKNKLPEQRDMEPKKFIKEWSLKLTPEQEEAFDAHNKVFAENFKTSLKYYKKFDYNQAASYHERCDDIFCFVVDTVNKYTQDIHQRSQNIDEAKSYVFKRELETLRAIKADIQYLILYLQEYVSLEETK